MDQQLKVKVSDMEPGFLYRTTGPGQHKCRVLEKVDILAEEAELHFYEHQYNNEWMVALVPPTYLVQVILDENSNMKPFDELSREQENTHNSPRKKLGGIISGLSMMECWGLYFRKFIDKPGGRELIIEGMTKEFPTKAESHAKWVDSYKSYYNLGRLPGCIKQVNKKQWLYSDPLQAFIGD